MGRTLRPQVALYLDPEKVVLLDELAEQTGETKQALLRRAVDDLLVKHKKLKTAAKTKRSKD